VKPPAAMGSAPEYARRRDFRRNAGDSDGAALIGKTRDFDAGEWRVLGRDDSDVVAIVHGRERAKGAWTAQMH